MADPDQSQTPHKGARDGRPSERAHSSRRGGRRGGRGGDGVQNKYPQGAEPPQTYHENGTFDDNGHFLDDSSSHKQSKRARQKRNPVVTKPSNPIPAPVDAAPLSQSPFMSTPPKQYYAGPAFHQSPAASALPMPRFLSKSVPKAGKSAPSLLEHAETAPSGASSSDSTTPEPSPSMSQIKPHGTQPPRQTESPLDKLFQAARAEKVKQNNTVAQNFTNSPNTTIATAHPTANQPTSNHWASIYGNRPNHHRSTSTDSSRGLFPMDVEGKPQHAAASPAKNMNASALSLHRTVSDGTQHIQQNHHGNRVYTAPESSIMNQAMSKPSMYNPDFAARQAPAQHFASNPLVPLSAAPITPMQNSHNADTQSNPLHYGNKNLSPMFQAARTNSPRSHSSLRHQLGAELLPPMHQQQPELHQATLHQYPNYGSPVHHATASLQQYHGGPPGNGQPLFAGNDHSSSNESHHSSISTPHGNSETAKMQALSDNLRNMLKIPRT